MAVKTFAVGEVLTASDTNTYLNNGALVYVASKTWSSTTGAQQINGCFTSTYDNYRLVLVATGTSTSQSGVRMKLAANGTTANSAYYTQGLYIGAGGAAPVSYWDPNTTNGFWAGAFANLSGNGIIDLLSPNLAVRTHANVLLSAFGDTNLITSTNWNIHLTASAYDGVYVATESGGTWSGTLTVFGYRKA